MLRLRKNDMDLSLVELVSPDRKILWAVIHEDIFHMEDMKGLLDLIEEAGEEGVEVEIRRKNYE